MISYVVKLFLILVFLLRQPGHIVRSVHFVRDVSQSARWCRHKAMACIFIVAQLLFFCTLINLGECLIDPAPDPVALPTETRVIGFQPYEDYYMPWCSHGYRVESGLELGTASRWWAINAGTLCPSHIRRNAEKALCVWTPGYRMTTPWIRTNMPE